MSRGLGVGLTEPDYPRASDSTWALPCRRQRGAAAPADTQ